MIAEVELTVNGRPCQVEVDPRATLVELLRDTLGLTGTHVGCGTGNCGACTVMLNGETVKSCCVLALDAVSSEVLTIEGLSNGAGDLHPIQRAFAERQGLQCGFCTPGMIMSTLQLLQSTPAPSEDEIRYAIAGNLCRCTGYAFVVEAVAEASATMRSEMLVKLPRTKAT